ncbi:hypothetical protein PIB30_005469 [Stylosanthes scabra]|uniref:Uncharacterized protein n=1 Tax=Stylosanthes scabra TaxID=79078 RepID=A0ABU6Y0P3_9FABA|nr:hypothetical protein [Stylosanthes scabra]
MIFEIIDLTRESPPRPPPLPPPSRRSVSEEPTILNFANGTTTIATNGVWPSSMHIYDPSLHPSHRYYHHQPLQASNENNNNNSSSFFFQPYMNANHLQHQHQVAATAVTTTHEPVSQSQQTAFMFSHPNNNCLPADDWTLEEQELFMMGLRKYGRGRWNEIAGHYLNNKTPQQIQNYADNFFYDSFRGRRNSSSSIYSPSSTASFRTYSSENNNNNDEPIKETLMLFPEKKENDHREVFTREFATTITNTIANNNYAYGLLFGITPTTTTIGESSSIGDSGNYHEEIDLELRLGDN